MGGVVFGLVVGYLLDHGFGYGRVFAIVSTLHVIAFRGHPARRCARCSR